MCECHELSLVYGNAGEIEDNEFNHLVFLSVFTGEVVADFYKDLVHC